VTALLAQKQNDDKGYFTDYAAIRWSLLIIAAAASVVAFIILIADWFNVFNVGCFRNIPIMLIVSHLAIDNLPYFI
jgi:hypothetical protein